MLQVLDDFIRNFMIKMKLNKTLETFQVCSLSLLALLRVRGGHHQDGCVALMVGVQRWLLSIDGWLAAMVGLQQWLLCIDGWFATTVALH